MCSLDWVFFLCRVPGDSCGKCRFTDHYPCTRQPASAHGHLPGIAGSHWCRALCRHCSQDVGIFWFGFCSVSSHALQGTASGVLLAMAFDHYVAICDPLRHTFILIPFIPVSMVLVVAIRAIQCLLHYTNFIQTPFPFHCNFPLLL